MKKSNLIMIFVGAVSSVSAFAQDVSLEERLKNLEERIELAELEAKFSNRLNISGTLINHFESMDMSRKGNGLEDSDERSSDGTVAATHFQLNFDFSLSKQLSILTSLGMGKIWNNDGREGIAQSSYRSNQGSYGYTGSDVKVDTAFLRWTAVDGGWSFALGRMTTLGGPPMNQLDGFPRKGAYPRFGYNAILDGAAVVYDFKKFLPSNHSFKSRFFYTPHFFVDSNDRWAPQRDANDNEVVRRADQVAMLHEYEYTGNHFAKRTSVYAMLLHYNQFYDAEFQEAGRSKPSYYEGYITPFFLGLEGIAQSNLNYSVTYLRLMERTSLVDTYYAHSFLHNLNYRLNEDWVIGAEYIKTGKNYYLEEYAYLHFSNFYLRGNSEGYHPFISYQIDLHQRIRLGWFYYRAGHDKTYAKEYTEKGNNLYLSYRVDF